MSASQHALARSLRALTFGVAQKIETKRNEGAIDHLQEREQQFQLPVGGTASPDPATAVWTESAIRFETHFPSEADGMRNADFDTPQVWFGVVVTSQQPVGVHACVRNWLRDEQSDVIGAVIAATAVAYGATTNVDFRGYLHATFQGWGAPEDNYDDTEGSGTAPEDEG